jgi:hypothetical protein
MRRPKPKVVMKGIGSTDEYFLRPIKLKSVLSVHAIKVLNI